MIINAKLVMGMAQIDCDPNDLWDRLFCGLHDDGEVRQGSVGVFRQLWLGFDNNLLDDNNIPLQGSPGHQTYSIFA